MTRQQSMALKLFGVGSLLASALLVYFAYAGLHSRDLATAFAILPSAVLSLVLLVAGIVLILKGLGKVDQ